MSTRDAWKMNDEQIDEELRTRREELATLEDLRQQRARRTGPQIVAEEMHRVLCRSTHHNPGYDCDWPHEAGFGDPHSDTHNRYLTAAQSITGRAGGHDNAMEIISILRELRP